MQKAIFVDKDGTLVRDVPYNVDTALIELSDECVEGLKLLFDEGYKIIIISNQSGIARGYFEEQEIFEVREHIESLLADHGIRLTGFYYCPHHPEGVVSKYRMDCKCRKPAPGMIQQAALDHNIDLYASWMIGDILHDVEAGNRAGCRTILIDNGNETEWQFNPYRKPTEIVGNINEAASIILQQVVV